MNEKEKVFNFWKQQLSTIKTDDIQYEIVPTTWNINNIECNQLYFKSFDDNKIHCQYIKPEKSNNKLLLLFHGYHCNSGDWSDKIYYAGLGYTVLAMDVRGQSGETPDCQQTNSSTLKGQVIKGHTEGPSNLLMTAIYKDVFMLSKLAQKLEPLCEIYSIGESQGGALAIVSSALNPQIKKVFTSMAYLADFKKAYELGYSYDGVEHYFKFEDPLHETEEKFFDVLSYIDIINLAYFVQAEVHYFIGLKDTVSPIECQMKTYENIPSVKHMYKYPEYGHEYLPKRSDIILREMEKNEN